MTSKLDLIIRHATLMTPSGREQQDIGIFNGKIVDIGDLATRDTKQQLDAEGWRVLPGVIDSQVHFRDPGHPHKEDFASGTRAAILGGVTTVFDMPNTDPLTISHATLLDKILRAQGRAWCNYAFYVGGCAANLAHVADLEGLPGVAGMKIFMGSSTGGLLTADDDTLLKLLKQGRRRVAVHAEDEPRLMLRKPLAESAGHPRAHPEWRDVSTALFATRRLIALAAEANRPVHVLHISTADEIAFLSGHKHLATMEVLPQHLTLCAPECYEYLGTFAQMNPPIRGISHQEALWQAVTNGLVDTLGSDHAPHTVDEKARPYPASPSGMPGVQTLLPLMLHHVTNGKLTLERLVDLTSAGPARTFGIASKGRIAVGYDADLTIVDLHHTQIIDEAWLASRCGWSPFAGMEVTGWPMATIVGGHISMLRGMLHGIPSGRIVRFTGGGKAENRMPSRIAS